MNSKYDTYTSPLAERNASKEMLRIWSPSHKFRTWRRIWLAVAEAQHEMGLPVTKEQVEEIRAHLDVTDDDMARAEEHERRLRHDVMAVMHAPEARPHADASGPKRRTPRHAGRGSRRCHLRGCCRNSITRCNQCPVVALGRCRVPA